MDQNGFIFKIGDLANQDHGANLNFDVCIKDKLKFEDNVWQKSSIKGNIGFMRVEGGINVEIKNTETNLEFKCVKCTEKFARIIKIPHAERVFHFEEQQGDIDIFDTFYINTKNMSIDVSDFLRQEIILHFPSIPVCSKSCEGLCAYCGKNLNKESCDCDEKVEKTVQEKPLSSLKKLYKSSNKR